MSKFQEIPDYQLLSDTETTDEECSGIKLSLDKKVEVESPSAPDIQKKFKCQVCDYASKLKGNLLRHERTHTGEGPYKCNQCRKAFTRKTNCQRHEQSCMMLPTLKKIDVIYKSPHRASPPSDGRNRDKIENSTIGQSVECEPENPVIQDNSEIKDGHRDMSEETLSNIIYRKPLINVNRNKYERITQSKPNKKRALDDDPIQFRQYNEKPNDNYVTGHMRKAHYEKKYKKKLKGKGKNAKTIFKIETPIFRLEDDELNDLPKLSRPKRFRPENKRDSSHKEKTNGIGNEIEVNVPEINAISNSNIISNFEKRRNRKSYEMIKCERIYSKDEDKNQNFNQETIENAPNLIHTDKKRKMGIFPESNNHEGNLIHNRYGKQKAAYSKITEVACTEHVDTQEKILRQNHNSTDAQGSHENEFCKSLHEQTKESTYRSSVNHKKDGLECDDINDNDNYCNNYSSTLKGNFINITGNHFNTITNQNNEIIKNLTLAPNSNSNPEISASSSLPLFTSEITIKQDNKKVEEEVHEFMETEEETRNNRCSINSVIIPGQRTAPHFNRETPTKDMRSQTSLTPVINDFCDIKYLFRPLLHWNPSWFDEHDKVRKIPSDIKGNTKIVPLQKYLGKEEYLNTMLQHLLLEAWESCLLEWKQKKTLNESPEVTCIFKGLDISYDGLFHFVNFSAKEKDKHLNTGDLVIIKRNYNRKTHSCLGYIDSCSRKPGSAFQIDIVVRMKPYKKSNISNENSPGDAFKNTTFKVIGSLKTIVSWHAAIVNMFDTRMCTRLINPGEFNTFAPLSVQGNGAFLHEVKQYNSTQRKGIHEAVRLCTEKTTFPRICLIQGAAGTGKTYTIVGMVNQIIQRCDVRICLCSQSWSGVASLIHELERQKETMNGSEGGSYPRIVIVGETPVDRFPALKKYSLRKLVKEAINRNKIKRSNLLITKKINELQGKLNALKNDVDQRIKSWKLSKDVLKLSQKIKDLEEKNLKSSRDLSEKIKEGVLLRCNVVCGTFCSFSDPFLLNALSYRKNGIREAKFDVMIMDEAHQATEVETLLPLQCGTNLMIMAGDLNQLQPTVLSEESFVNGFHQSMYERLVYHAEKEEHNSILYLKTQYRMHDEIAMFPRNNLYRHLKTQEYLKERSKKFCLKPLLVFELENTDWCQTIEEFTVLLCKFLRHFISSKGFLTQRDIGIITTGQHSNTIKEGLKSRNLNKVDVGNIKDFAGREKEIIILTAQSSLIDNHDRFVMRNKEINVAMTRARTALYVVANPDSWQSTHSEWRSLIEDARNRNLLHHVKKDSVLDTVFNYCINDIE